MRLLWVSASPVAAGWMRGEGMISMRRSLGTKLGAGLFLALMAVPAAWAEEPKDWQLGMLEGDTPVRDAISSFHNELLVIITLITIFVMGLLAYVMVKFNAKRHPVPSTTTHNTLLEVVWTAVPVLILVAIAIPSFKLLYYEAEIPKPDLTIKVIGKQWFWTYEYPAQKFTFDSEVLTDDQDKAAGKPRLLGVIHSWAVPQFGVKMDAVPGRINKTWFKATETGVFYGQCSELCGVNHDAMPIEVHVVTDAEYAAWLAAAKKNTKIYQSIADAAGADTRLAAQ
jgi:cytochrome c oxidase subunit II